MCGSWIGVALLGANAVGPFSALLNEQVVADEEDSPFVPGGRPSVATPRCFGKPATCSRQAPTYKQSVRECPAIRGKGVDPEFRV
jgi:hypothetical protein